MRSSFSSLLVILSQTTRRKSEIVISSAPLIALIEMISGKKLPLSVLMPLQIIGMVLLFTLLIYANGMDVVRLFN